MQYRVTGWGGHTRGEAKEVSREKKYLDFTGRTVEKSTDDIGADIVVTSDEQRREQGLNYPTKPSKARYQPGKDRSRRRRKR